MDAILIKLLNMSLTASLLALVVMLVRLLFRKMPKKIGVFLWALVALRLILPFSIQSTLSLVPDNEPLRQESFGLSVPSSSPIVDTDEWTTVGVSGEYEDVYPTVPVDSDGTAMGKKPFPVLPAVWIAGVSAMLLYAAVSYLRIKRKTGASMETEKGVYLCDDIGTPFILGIIAPKIYIPSSLNEAQKSFVLSHEKAHIKRLDFLWKPLGFLLLSVYWFNPVLWLAYILLCRDIELACDEKVIQNMENADKADYSQTLLDCSSPKRSVAACPLAFGETGVKTRVKNILNFKKPAFWVIAAAVIVAAALAVFFLTDPMKNETPEPTTNDYLTEEYASDECAEPEAKADLEEAIHEVLITRKANSYAGECLTEGHVTLGTDKTGGSVKAYLLTCITSYGFENGYFTEVGGSMVPTVLHFREENGLYVFEECIEAEDGGRYADSIREMYPLKYRSRVLGEWSEADNKAMIEQCRAQAQAYLDSIGRNEEIRNWGDIEHTLFSDVGISAEAEDKIYDKMKYMAHYELGFGYEEVLEDGVRVIYRAAYDKESNTVIYTKEDYESGEILYRYVFFGETGDAILPVNISFAETARYAEQPLRDMQAISSYLYEKLAGECTANERRLAHVTKLTREPLGMAGLFDGMEVYKTEYTVFTPLGKTEGELAYDLMLDKKDYTEYFFLYYTTDTDNCTVAGVLTYDDIKELYGNEGNAGSDEVLLRAAAGELMKDIPPAEEKMRTLYPEAFEVECGKGLEVYVWKTSEAHYHFGLLPGTDREKLPEELWEFNLNGLSANEMSVILQSYDIPPEDIAVIPFQHPLSSYWWNINDPELSDGDTIESLREMLGIK